MTRGPNLTVQQLIYRLSKVEDKSTVVSIDGCDCSEIASFVYWSPERDYVCIGRADQSTDFKAGEVEIR